MKIAISQPTFLPWCGFFSLISNVDQFVFLDQVQFDKRSWQQRNYISVKGEKKLLTIPVKSKGKFNQFLEAVEIDYENFNYVKLMKTLEHSYSKSPNFLNLANGIEDILKIKHKFLCDLNIDLIKYFCSILEIKTKLIRQSEINIPHKGKEKTLSQIAIKNNATTYISTIGAKAYLKNKTLIDTNIKIYFFEYTNKRYNQINNNSEFIPNLSIVDLIFNEGINSRSILKENFKLIQND